MTQPAHIAEPVLMYVDAPQLPHIWPKLYEMIAPACEMALTPEAIKQAILADRAVAWIVVEGSRPTACAVTQRRKHADREWIEVVTLGAAEDAEPGGLERWSDVLMAGLARYARGEGLVMRAQARPGLFKLMREFGWRERFRVMEWSDG